MAKLLTVKTASNGNLMIPAEKIIFCGTSGSPFTSTSIYYSGVQATFDVITITHAADTSSGNNMINYLQSKFVEVAQSKWSEGVLDITDDAPTVISNVTIA